MKKRIAVYTCITGDYDNLREIDNVEKGIDYYCFTNNKNIRSNTWNVVYIEDDSLSNVELARKIKILGHSIVNSYDILLWMDGAVRFTKNINDFIKKYLSDNDVFVAFKHGERDNIHDEAIACYRFNKEVKSKVKKLFKFYDDVKYPDNNGLIESTVYIKRPKDKVVQATMNLWFDMIINYSHRDQLSFNYCIYKTKLKVKWINKKVFSNEWFDWKKHNYNHIISNYSIYYGDIDNYDFNNEIKGKFKISGSNYVINEKVPLDVSKIYVFVTDVPCVKYDNLKIAGINNKNITVYNTIQLNNEKVVYNDQFIICIDKKFSKGQKINLSIDLIPMDEGEVYEFVNSLAVDNIKKHSETKNLLDIIDEKQAYIECLWSFINSSFICRLILKIKKFFTKKYNNI